MAIVIEISFFHIKLADEFFVYLIRKNNRRISGTLGNNKENLTNADEQ